MANALMMKIAKEVGRSLPPHSRIMTIARRVDCEIVSNRRAYQFHVKLKDGAEVFALVSTSPRGQVYDVQHSIDTAVQLARKHCPTCGALTMPRTMGH